MSKPAPGPLLASGRAADVFDIGEGRVLRRYRNEHRDGADALREARLLEHVRRHGFPVPEVFDATERDLVMERLTGPTMLDDLAKRPWTLRRAASRLAELHEQLHDVPVIDDLPTPFGGGDSLLHLDLHPDNVIMTPRGAVVIDWQNAGRGPAGADLAKTWIILGTAQVAGARWKRLISVLGRRLFLGSFLRHVDVHDAERHLSAVAEVWNRNPRVTAAERELATRLATRTARSGNSA